MARRTARFDVERRRCRSCRNNLPKLKSGIDSSLIARLLRLSLTYRRECALVFLLQGVLLVLGVSGLGLSGVAIDVIRAALDPKAPAPRFPLHLAPPPSLGAKELLVV